ncbi:MAG TPA: hypothetical protein VFE73_19140 [Reyranella sp.]|jgi:hypothetical protein|nr:hypothetical protein [Reyranella sp.]
MASLVDYGAALRFVQTRAEALGHGFAGPHPRALFTCLRSSLPILSQPCDAFHRPGQIRAHARILAQCEELLVTVAAALHSRDAGDEEKAIQEARRLCRLLAESRSVLERDA